MIATFKTKKCRRKALHCCDKPNEFFDIFQVILVFKSAKQLGLEVRIWLDTTKIHFVFTKFSPTTPKLSTYILSVQQLHGLPVVNSKRTRLGTLWKLRSCGHCVDVRKSHIREITFVDISTQTLKGC